MEYIKLQTGCMLIVLYVAFIYLREKYAYRIKQKEPLFEALLIMGICNIAFDGITAYTVNHLEQIPGLVNAIFHACFLCSLDAMVFLIFLYILELVMGIPEEKTKRIVLVLPFIGNIVVVLLFMPQLYYCKGEITNYSMGIPAYTCYIMVAVYMMATIAVLIHGWRHLEYHKRITISTCILISVAVTIYQMIHPQALLSCLVPTFVTIGSYLNIENPLFVKLQAHNQEMVMGFATLVENRDGSTGGHIRRTTTYAKMLAEELKARGFCQEQLTEDYIKDLILAAPMHDVGKIAIPDAILQKSGKLTEEEYAVMKTHTEKGAQIVQETFGQIGNPQYEKMAYEVARHHHEKWNGKGYPDGLAGKEIPLCARIMSIADVFDAVSAKRCYRDALPLEQCFSIIENGSGRDFDPFIVDVFLDIKDKITEVCSSNEACEYDG